MDVQLRKLEAQPHAQPQAQSAVASAVPLRSEDLTERTILTAINVSPLVAMDRSQILAAAGRVAARALARPRPLLRRTGALAQELAQVVVGKSDRQPHASDRRFTDVTFREHPLYRRVMQAYLAWREAVLGLVGELDLDAKSQDRGRFALSLFTEAVAPTNTLLGNPLALKRAFETGGASLWSGLRHLAHDVRQNGGMPAQVDRRPFRVGETLAVTPGQVVFRDEVLEVLQYAPSTPRVYARPLLMIPPQINKYYILDLAPGRSLIEYAVSQGFQVFAVSWRNPTPAQRDWGLEKYLAALLGATDVVRQISGSDRLNVLGACAGGITTAVLLGHLAARGDDRVPAATFPVTVLDTSVESAVGLFASEKTVASAIARSQKMGILSGREMSRSFAWLRPNDLVWNYWANNYLQGAEPPAFDILYWNNDVTNLPATLHAEFLELFLKNSLCHPGTLEVLGTPIDLGKVRADVYAVGALTDHITPWRACFRTPQLFGGSRTFTQSSSGHIQALVNPLNNLKSAFFTGSSCEADEKAWLSKATEHKGTWWTHWRDWVAERSGDERPAPAKLGSELHPPLMPSPGRYVHQSATPRA
jgi:polyhydroxyalkanoate synthase